MILRARIRWRVGNGTQVRVKLDTWLPIPRIFKPISSHESMPELVVDLIDGGIGQWRSDVVPNCFGNEEARCILSMPLSKFGCDDKLIWHHTKSGVYTVKSGYYIAQELSRNGELGKKWRGESSAGQGRNTIWSSIWKLDVPGKLQHLIWRSCKNILAVKVNLQHRGIRHPTICPICGGAEETEPHIWNTYSA